MGVGGRELVDHAAFGAVGGFDENLFLYKEDEDLCLRLRKAGGTVVYEPDRGDSTPGFGGQ